MNLREQEQKSRPEIHRIYNSLSCLAVALVNQNILIDLRNETSVAGRITNVDGYMNISMERVVYIDQKGLQYEMDNFTVYPRFIRYIHIPQHLDIKTLINEQLALMRAPQRNRRPKTESFKRLRAKQRHLQTLQDIQTARAEREAAAGEGGGGS